MILIGRPFRLSKFMVSRALSAVCVCVWGGERGGRGKDSGHDIVKARRRVEKEKKERGLGVGQTGTESQKRSRNTSRSTQTLRKQLKTFQKPQERRGKRFLTVGWFLEVDVGISQRATSDNVSADANGQNSSGLVEFLEQHGLVQVRMKVSHVERGDGVVGPS